jgi:tripartite-type tricarboxylate transporter receptor subunit TctC
LALATPLIRDGKARALGLSAPTRSPVFPALPTISEQGFAGFQMGDWLGLFAPAATPAPVIARLAAAAKEALEQPALAPRLEALGLTPAADGPEAFARFLAAERAEMRELIAAEGIRLE